MAFAMIAPTSSLRRRSNHSQGPGNEVEVIEIVCEHYEAIVSEYRAKQEVKEICALMLVYCKFYRDRVTLLTLLTLLIFLCQGDRGRQGAIGSRGEPGAPVSESRLRLKDQNQD